MNNPMTRIAIMTACLTLSACISPAENAEEFTKEDAKKIVDPDQDLCAVHSWYGDGVCDTFCENADSDCTVECAAVPVCDSSSYEVEACSPSGTCEEVMLCGTTIVCEQEEDPECFFTPVLDCDEGYELVEVCATDTDCYEASQGCAQMFCQGPLIQCDAIPVCPDDYLEVDLCPTDTDCYEETLCGRAVSCMKDARCEQPAQPMCPADRYLIQTCPTDSDCTEEVICGITVSCMEGSIDCLNPPECPVGTTSVSVCDSARPCNEVIDCGIRLYCEDNII